MTGALRLVGARVIDPATDTDRVMDLWVDEHGVHDVRGRGPEERETIDLAGKVVVPAFVEIHAHLREPGGEESETIATGCAAARAGGYGHVLAMANSPRTNDNPGVTRDVLAAAAAAGSGVRVYPVTAATIGLGGEVPAPWREQVEAGCVAISDDGKPVARMDVLEEVLRATNALGVPYLSHAECPGLFHGAIHAGEAARRLGVGGISAACESDAVHRELELAARIGARLHVCHVSTRESLAALRAARGRGVRATCEATPHHLTLSDAAFLDRGPDPNLKMNPPLRPPADREALREALRDGLVQAVATDHAPHAARLKAKALADAAFGVIGMETAFAVLHEDLVVVGGWPLPLLVRRMTVGPADAIGLAAGRLFQGPPMLTVLDPEAKWRVRPETFLSKSRNCPWAGAEGRGRVVATIFGCRWEPSTAPGASDSAREARERPRSN
jgi:dihydroorotase